MNKKILQGIVFGLVISMVFTALTTSGIETNTKFIESSTVEMNSNVGLVGYWNFDEGNGNIAQDNSGYGNNGIIYDAVWTTGIYGNALDFDGKDDYVDCGDSDSLDIDGALTMAAWIKIDYESNPTARILSKRYLEYIEPWEYYFYSYELGVSTSSELFFVIDGDFNYGNVVPMEQWVHVAVTLNKYGTGKTYINGQLDETFTDNPLPTPNNEPLTIGISSDLITSWFNGIIDEVYIFNRDLTESEIQDVMEGLNLPPYKPEITGPKCGKTSEELNYKFVSFDFEDDDIASYIIDWGDNLYYEIIEGPFASGEEVNLTHIWKDKGTFTIKAKAVDLDGQGSDWGEFEVSITRAKTISNNLFQKLIDHFPNAFQLIRQLFGWL